MSCIEFGDDERDYGDDEDRRMPDGTTFARPGSALRAATARNPRNLPCPTCGQANRLTPADRRAVYQCDTCADRAEGAYMGGDY